MLVFPPERRVRPPDYAGTGRAAVAQPTVDVRAVEHPAAATPPTPRFVRPLREPAAPREPRRLEFEPPIRVPLPGTPRVAPSRGDTVRAIVYANPPLAYRFQRPLARPQPPGQPRVLQFPDAIRRRLP